MAERYTMSATCVACQAADNAMPLVPKINHYYANREAYIARNHAWKAANKDKDKATQKAWRKANGPRLRALKSKRRAMELQAEGFYTSEDVARIYKLQHGKCAYCRVSLANGYHDDHITALVNGGTNWPSNIQLLCQPCNNKKHVKDPIEFAQGLGLLC
jgi:5-methylcytosine-specific restriction endonuclease McrA